MKLRANDTVIIISGKNKGKKGKIMRVLAATNKVVVEQVNIRTKHVKKKGNEPGQIIRYEAPIDASNVQLIDPKSGKPTRVGYKMIAGKKTRVAKKSGEPV